MNDTFTSRLTDLIVRPGNLMDRVREAPRWVPALLLVVVVMGVATWFITPISDPERLEIMRDSRLMQMMPEEQWQEQYEQALNPTTTKLLWSSLGAAFFTGVVVLLGGVILAFFARLGGGQGTVKQSLGVMSWASVISVGIGMVVKLPFILMTESTHQSTISLAALLPEADPGSTLFQLLSNYTDFITWWGLIVLIIGYQRVFQMHRTAAALTVLLPWALLMAAAVGINLLVM